MQSWCQLDSSQTLTPTVLKHMLNLNKVSFYPTLINWWILRGCNQHRFKLQWYIAGVSMESHVLYSNWIDGNKLGHRGLWLGGLAYGYNIALTIWVTPIFDQFFPLLRGRHNSLSLYDLQESHVWNITNNWLKNFS